MPAYICRTCGNQQPDFDDPPLSCPICEDERQYVGWRGQEWVTLRDLAAEGYRTVTREVESGLWGVGVEPSFAIGRQVT